MLSDSGLMKKIILTVVLIIIGLVIIELILRLIPVSDPYFFQKIAPNRYLRYPLLKNRTVYLSTEDSLPGFKDYTDVTAFTTNNYGFRDLDRTIVPKPANEYRIFAVGGSTTECGYLDDGDDWPALLQELLNQKQIPDKKINVINTGKSGDATIDHIALLAHRIVHLQPDMIIISPGINDINRLICKPDSVLFNEKKTIPVVKHFLTEFQIFRRVYYVLKPGPDFKNRITVKSSYKKIAEANRNYSITETLPEVHYSWFDENINTLIGICKAHSIPLVFTTQQTTWMTNDDQLGKWHWMIIHCDNRYQKSDLKKMIDRLNKNLISISQDADIPVFRTDLLLENTSKNFYDDCHFNYHGSKNMAETLSEFVIENRLLQSSLISLL